MLFDPASVQADDGAGLTQGIIGLVNNGQPRKPDDWGALRAGPGARDVGSTIWRPIRRWMRSTSGSRASRGMGKRRW